MRLSFHGGFGEKGRTCIGVRAGDYHALLDAGVKTSARGREDYYPAISPAMLAEMAAIVITHAHEDHVAALGWCLRNGFRGRILMTAQAREDSEEILRAYGAAGDAARLGGADVATLSVGTNAATLGPMRLHTGRSGHIVGGVWCVVDDGHTRFGYCGDVVPSSPVFAMDPLPPCDVVAIDASYGDDDITFAERGREIAAWVAAHARGSILPSPLLGRSLELFSLLEGEVALAPGMRTALGKQLGATPWLSARFDGALRRRLEDAPDWSPGDPLPGAPVLCHDGMGMSGPARDLLGEATRTGHPVLLTGHVPEGSPARLMMARGQATWIRLPTHPTLAENVALVRSCEARVVLGHSCEHHVLAGLQPHIPGLRIDVRTGDEIDLA